MFETPIKDPLNMPWWSESFDASPPRRGSVGISNCKLGSIKVKPDDIGGGEIDFAAKKLQWISREDHNSPPRISVDRASIQNGSAHGRSARFGGFLDSPGRGIQTPSESPARRGESVRRVRTPSVDFDNVTESPNRASPRSRLRYVSQKEGSAVAKSDHNVIREASAIRKVLAARDQRKNFKPMVQSPTKESASMIPMGNSPESNRMVVSYLAEETDRIIKGRMLKLKLKPGQTIVADQEQQATDHERSSAREVRNANGGRYRREPSNSSSPQVDKTNRASRLAFSSSPGSPLGPVTSNAPSTTGGGFGPTRTISATMENYLENRRRGSNLGSQIAVSNQLESPSRSRRSEASRRKDGLAGSRAALSPLNGNEGPGEDPNRGGRKDSKESAQTQGENGFPSRLQYWTEFLGKGEMESTEGLNHLNQQIEERISRSGRKELGTTPGRLHSNGLRGQSPLDRRQIDSYVRHPGARGHSQRYEEVGTSLLPDRKLGPGSRGHKHNSSRRSQSCRRDTIINSLLDSFEEKETVTTKHLASLVRGLDTSTDFKSSRFSVEFNANSKDSLPEKAPSTEKFLKNNSHQKESSEHKHARRSSVSVMESGGKPLSNSNRYSVSVPKSREYQRSTYSTPLHRASPSPGRMDESHHPRMETSSQTRAANLDSQLSENKKASHRSSHSLDQGSFKKLFVHTKKDNRNGSSLTTSTSVSQACKMNSPKTNTKPQPASPGTSLQRWIANQFKFGSRSRSSSTGKDRQEPEQRNQSPWRRIPAELFQNITRRMGGSIPRSIGASKFDTRSIAKLPQVNPFEGDSSSHSQSPVPRSTGASKFDTKGIAKLPQVKSFEGDSSSHSQSPIPRSTGASKFDTKGIAKLPKVNPFEGDSSSHSQSPKMSPSPWHLRVKYSEPSGKSSPHGTYLLPTVASLSPAHSKSLPIHLKIRQQG